MRSVPRRQRIDLRRPPRTRRVRDWGWGAGLFPGVEDLGDEPPGAIDLVGACEQCRVAEHDVEQQPFVCLGGRHGDKPPGDEDGFLTYARRLRTPTVYNAIKDAKRVGEIVRFGFPASVWRHFERLETFPRALLPFADAVCRFNPVYGQGMSVAAQEACLLHRLLGTRSLERDPLAGLAPALIAVAGFDPLRDEGESYAEALRAAGTAVDLRSMGSPTHGFANLFPLGGGSAAATNELISALRAHLSRA